MYDTIKLSIPIEKIDEDGISRLLQNLPDFTEHKKKDGQEYVSGNLKNFRVNLSGQGVHLTGSLAKYFLPDNLHTLTRSDSKRALEQLSDELHLPIKDAIVKRIDFSQNFLMKYKPESYYKYLGESQHYNRLTQEKSLYYSNGLRTKLFYNKIAEAKHKRIEIPEIWKNENVLRYELRFKDRLPLQFNISELKASMLYDDKFYIGLFDRWHSEYQSINKINIFNLNLTDMNSPNDFMKQLQLYAISSIGQDRIMSEIEHLRASKIFDKPEYYSRLKKNIKQLCSMPKLTESSELIDELDKKVADSKRFYR
jgi:hypothetical protein